MLAKAACGLTNADGGVLVIGMRAESTPKDEPDVVTASAPVDDTSLVKSRILGLISNLVEPGILGIEVVEIAENLGSKSGFVIVYLPKAEGTPRRSRKDWKFYQRIGSATLPMEYWQLEAMFGRRPAPQLSLHIEISQMFERSGYSDQPLRHLIFGLKDEGRGIAKFPGIRLKQTTQLQREDFGIDGNSGFGLPPRPSEPGWIVFRGGVDDVIYPNETRMIGKLIQNAVNRGEKGLFVPGQVNFGFQDAERTWACESITLEAEISAEGSASRSVFHQLDEDFLIEKYRVR
jgi:hypothetical protein